MIITGGKPATIIYFCPAARSMQSEDQNDSPEVLQGRWLDDEHDRFLQGIMEHGKDWKIIQKTVKTRTGSQVRSHAQKFFIKLNRLSRERKKCKNWDLIQPSDIQRQILDKFNEGHITPNTPPEVCALIRKDWRAVASSYQEKKEQAKNYKQATSKKPKAAHSPDQPNASAQQDQQICQQAGNPDNSLAEDQQQSYFIKIIKMNKEHFIGGHDFKELIDFKQTHSCSNQQSLSAGGEQPRKHSFCLPDEEDNETKLKETLSNLHRRLGYPE